MRKALSLLVIACAAAQGAQAGTIEEPQRIVPCAESIDFARFPFLGAYRKRDRWRAVLGSVSVPPDHGQRAFGPGTRGTFPAGWRYFAKRGMVVKTGMAVTISVPARWRTRVAIAWGNVSNPPFHTLRIAACRLNNSKRGVAYAGGFFLRRPTACVPLTFTVGNRRKTMWFGIGKDCR